MTKEKYIEATPLVNDSDMLTAALGLFHGPEPEAMSLEDISVLSSSLASIINSGSGNASITAAINAASIVYRNALKTAISTVQDTIDAALGAL